MIEKTYVPGRWGQVHLRLAGDPALPPLLLLHPTPKSGWLYEGLMAALSGQFRLIAPDTPGYGASDPPPAPASMFEHADALLDVLAGLAASGSISTAPVNTLGYHTGSSLSVAMAQRQPERIGRLVLVSIAAYDAATRAAKLEKLKDWPGPRPDGSHMAAMWALVKSLAHPRADPDWLHVSVTENLRCGRRAPWGYAAVYGHDLQAALSSLSHEVLLLNPEDDLFDLTRANRHLLPAARYLELPGFGHGLFDYETATIAAEVRAFLAPLVNQHGTAMLDPGEGQ